MPLTSETADVLYLILWSLGDIPYLLLGLLIFLSLVWSFVAAVQPLRRR